MDGQTEGRKAREIERERKRKGEEEWWRREVELVGGWKTEGQRQAGRQGEREGGRAEM